MMMAAELALAKVDVAVLERRPDHVLVGSRAGGFHSRTIEVFDQQHLDDGRPSAPAEAFPRRVVATDRATGSVVLNGSEHERH
jgi:2-polyprenyl-6-methoxyphenol hydroxylase-like FAD-dependent oxidoreductase